MILSCIYFDEAGDMGRGVFTSRDIEAGTLIERAPVVVMSAEERKLLDKTLLHDYIFEWGENAEQCCMALGYAALYNHSADSNCEYEMDFENELINIRSVRKIAAGEQLFVNYVEEEGELWFEV